jgi:Zn-dependent metalloprotease
MRYLVLLLLLASTSTFAQISLTQKINVFEKGVSFEATELSNYFGLTEPNGLEISKVKTDKLGWTHSTYQQYYSGYMVEGVQYKLHQKDGVAKGMGTLINLEMNFAKLIEQEVALAFLGLDPLNQKVINSTLLVAPINGFIKNDGFRPMWKFAVDTKNPYNSEMIYLDAETGQVQWVRTNIHTSEGDTAVTRYSGKQLIITDSISPGVFVLHDTTKGIFTYDMNEGSSQNDAIDFFDNDNYWDNFNPQQDEVATDVHWGSAKTLEYFSEKLGRESYDGNGAALNSFVHVQSNYNNAFWNGYSLNYGDGDGNYFSPLTSLDIIGHEFGHGVTQYTAGLIYQKEPGALNESFSDIFGQAIEFEYKVGNWRIGEEITSGGGGLRNMSNPNEGNQPDTYKGDLWITADGNCSPSKNNDYCGVHYNSGVQNFWYYLLVEGGTGTNDVADNYNVTGIGLDKATKIAYRNLSEYLGPYSVYADAREGSIQSAIDLYGECSEEVMQCINAWYAVGVGDNLPPEFDLVDFSANVEFSCEYNNDIEFSTHGNGIDSAFWSFGEGTTSKELVGKHSYTEKGVYSVTVIAKGCSGELDTVMKEDYMLVNPDSSKCDTAQMLSDASFTTKRCSGKLFDQGGPFGNYFNDDESEFTIFIEHADSIVLDFLSFDYEMNYDSLFIYDGQTSSAPLIAGLTGNNLATTHFVSSGGAITFVQKSDQIVNKAGFELDWQCHISPPLNDFTWEVIDICRQEIVLTYPSTKFDSVKWFLNSVKISNEETTSLVIGQNILIVVDLQVFLDGEMLTISKEIDVAEINNVTFILPKNVLVNKIYTLSDTNNNTISWEWFVNGSSVATTSTYDYFSSDTGNVEIKLVTDNKYGCSFESTKSAKLVKELPIGIAEKNVELSLFPNPVYDGILNLKGLEQLSGDITIQVFTLEGKEVFQTIANNSSHTINVSSLKSGVYLVRVTSNIYMINEKISITH